MIADRNEDGGDAWLGSMNGLGGRFPVFVESGYIEADELVTDAEVAPEAQLILSGAVRELIVVDPLSRSIGETREMMQPDDGPALAISKVADGD